ncbi:MAG: hypothetical protein HQ552_07545 [Desulfobacteraceae bacterium]|nr:hypothetical protein [Desulfobacteraceae bacterium]
MKFFIAEQNLGSGATKEQAEKVIELLKEKGWDVDYGVGKNVAIEVSEFGQEEKIQDRFADDFMTFAAQVEEQEG